MGEYIFSCKSKELRGASSANIVTVVLASDADATTFAANLESLFSLNVISIDILIATNYTLPYPAGTDYNLRCQLWDDAEQTYNFRMRNIKSPFDVIGFEVALLAAGIQVPNASGDTNASSANTSIFKPNKAH